MHTKLHRILDSGLYLIQSNLIQSDLFKSNLVTDQGDIGSYAFLMWKAEFHLIVFLLTPVILLS